MREGVHTCVRGGAEESGNRGNITQIDVAAAGAVHGGHEFERRLHAHAAVS